MIALPGGRAAKVAVGIKKFNVQAISKANSIEISVLGMAAASVAQTTVQSALILSAGMISSNDFRTGTTIELDG